MQEEVIYDSLKKDLEELAEVLANTADTIVEQDVSKYPIFLLTKQLVELGVPVKAAKNAEDWNVHASTLEEFATKRLIDMEKVADFQKIYKNPKDFHCLFVLMEDSATFVFSPRNNNTKE